MTDESSSKRTWSTKQTWETPSPRPMWRIVVGMSVVIGLLVISMVLVSINESNTQANADRQSRENQSLQIELRCRAKPQLHYDQTDAALSILIADTLANLGRLSTEQVEERRSAIVDAIAHVRLALEEREKALASCVVEPDD